MILINLTTQSEVDAGSTLVAREHERRMRQHKKQNKMWYVIQEIHVCELVVAYGIRGENSHGLIHFFTFNAIRHSLFIIPYSFVSMFVFDTFARLLCADSSKQRTHIRPQWAKMKRLFWGREQCDVSPLVHFISSPFSRPELHIEH